MPATDAPAALDAAAFADLYERFETRVFNLCYRITGSREDAGDATQEAFLGLLRRLPQLGDREVDFGSYLFTSARNACYDLIARRKRVEPSDELPESAAPVGAGPGDPGDDPDRNVLLAAQQEEIRRANDSLPERQREVLALRELEELSYDEIAEIMGMNRNSVAQLISRARINLRDALRGTALQSIAASSPDCERGLPLLAMRQDGQLAPEDSGWLREHLASCETCRLSNEAMQEAGVSYRAWVPIGASPLLFRETMARAAELMGADWSEIRRRGGRRRRDLTIAALLAAILLVAVFEAELHDDPAPPLRAEPVSQAAPLPAAEPERAAKKQRKQKSTPADEPAATVEQAVAVDGGQVAGSEQTGPRPRQRTRQEATAQEQEPVPPAAEELPPTTTPTPDPPPPPTDPPTTTDPPPQEPPTEPPTRDPPIRDPPRDPPRVCRDANGRPIPCPRP